MSLSGFMIIAGGAFVFLIAVIVLIFFMKYQRIARLNRTGEQCMEWKIWDDAIACFVRALRLDSGHALSRYNLGFALYFGKNNPAAARNEFERAIAADETMAAAHYALGHLCLHCRHETAEARAHLEKALRHAPSMSEAYNTLGLLEIKEENWKGARDMFKKAVEINDRNDTAWCNRAIACVYQGQNAEATVCGETCVRLQPDSVLAHKNMGNIYGATGRRQEAIAELYKAVKLNPEDWIIHFWLGCLYLQTEQPKKAVVSFQEALRLHGEFALAHYNLALCYESLGRKQSARKHIDRAIELNPALGDGLI